MENIRKIAAVWKYQTNIQTVNSRTMIVLIMMFLYIRSYTEPIMEFSKAVNENISPYLFPLFMNDFVFPIIISLGYLVLICDAPFVNKGYLFLVARTGKMCWIIGEICFLLTYAMLYVLMILGLTVVNIFPRIAWSGEWGKIIMTLVRTDASVQFQTIELNPIVAENYSANEALIKTMLLSSFLFWLIGILVFALNYFFKNHLGVVAGGIVIFFDLAIYNTFESIYYKFSPVSLMKLSIVTGVNLWNPTYEYAIRSFILAVFLGSTLIIIIAKTRKGIQMSDRREG